MLGWPGETVNQRREKVLRMRHGFTGPGSSSGGTGTAQMRALDENPVSPRSSDPAGLQGARACAEMFPWLPIPNA